MDHACVDAYGDRGDVSDEGGCPGQQRRIKGTAVGDVAMMTRRTGENDGREVDEDGRDDDDDGRDADDEDVI